MATKHYTVWVGVQPGVYSTWREAEVNVKGIKGAKFKAFNSEEEANSAFQLPWQNFIDMSGPKRKVPEQELAPVPGQEQHSSSNELSGDVECIEATALINLLQEPVPDQYGLMPDEAPF